MEKPFCMVPVDLLMKWSGRLSDEEFGRLFKALYAHAALKVTPMFTGELLMAWNEILPNLIPCE